MKEKKTEVRIFTIADWEKGEQYLRLSLFQIK